MVDGGEETIEHTIGVLPHSHHCKGEGQSAAEMRAGYATLLCYSTHAVPVSVVLFVTFSEQRQWKGKNICHISFSLQKNAETRERQHVQNARAALIAVGTSGYSSAVAAATALEARTYFPRCAIAGTRASAPSREVGNLIALFLPFKRCCCSIPAGVWKAAVLLAGAVLLAAFEEAAALSAAGSSNTVGMCLMIGAKYTG